MSVVRRTGSGLRTIAAPFVVAPATGTSTTDRLRTTPAESEALREIGMFLGRLRREDYAVRSHEGRLDAKGKAVSRRERKRGLTAATSSRWASAITRVNEDQYKLATMALYDERQMLRSSIQTIETRLKLEPGSKGGYKTKAEWFQKTRRLNTLRSRLVAVDARVVAEKPRVVHGGGRLWRNRQNLKTAKLTQAGWRQEWDAKRSFLTADGATGEMYGNQTIRVDNDGYVTVKVPGGLVEKYGSHIRFETPLNLETNRADEWRDQRWLPVED